MTAEGFIIAYIPRGPDGAPARDKGGELLLEYRHGGYDPASAWRSAHMSCYANRAGALLFQGSRQIVWFLWVPSTRSVEEIEPGTLPEEVVRHARKRLAEARAPVRAVNATRGEFRSERPGNPADRGGRGHERSLAGRHAGGNGETPAAADRASAPGQLRLAARRD